jgi:hypothetical protein
MTINLGLDSSVWGTTVVVMASMNHGLVLISGPVSPMGCDEGGGSIATDLAGNVIDWDFLANTCAPGWNLMSHGSLDGSGSDSISYDLCFPPAPSTCTASVMYGPGPRPAGTGWSNSLPEPSSLILLAIALAVSRSLFG